MALKFKKLTRTGIRKLEMGERILEHGIIFERLPSGDGRYSVNIMVDGERIHRVIGKESDNVTRKSVEDYISKAKTDAREERLHLPKGRKVVLGFRQAAENYLGRLSMEGGKDLNFKKMRLEKHLVPFFKDTPLSKISTFDVERFKKNRLSEGARNGTINRELACLSHLLNKSEEWGWMAHRPAKINRLKEDRGKINYLTKTQIGSLIDASKQDQSSAVYPFIVIGLGTAMRKSEILAIKLENINLEQRCIYIPQAKAGARVQPITGELVKLLRGYLDSAIKDQVWLFPSQRLEQGHTRWIEKPFRRVVKASGLDPKVITPHTLRHTAITHLVQAGVDLPTVQRISGHKTLQMVVRYSHQNGEHIQEAMDKLERRYGKNM
ncbi:MAG: site-specific integrase [Deltaproteobacteria bacterium]|nr:site-specific integrase [Deltaproteobacteria bacterium]